ncbi:MAG TPA: hypothetical protein VH393_00580 [Ktedonobacterales bacterium]
MAEAARAMDGGYHPYPPDEQTRNWLAQTGFQLIEDAEGMVTTITRQDDKA